MFTILNGTRYLFKGRQLISMRMTPLRLLFLLFCVMFAAPPIVADDDLSGIYEGRVGDKPALLNLRVSGSVVSGRITQAGGADVDLNGTLSEGKMIGAASTKRGAGFFEGYREFGALVFLIGETGAITGQLIEVRAEFFPADDSVLAERVAATPVQRDQGLVGTWTAHGLAHRGDMVLPVTMEMILGPDGHYSHNSEPVKESKQGEWRSRNGKLEYRPRDSEAWSALGEYRLHRDNLIIILPDSEPRVWTRRPD